MNQQILTLRSKMAEAIKAIDIMQEAEQKLSSWKDTDSKILIEQSKRLAAARISEVGLCLDTLIATVENLESVTTLN